MKVKQSEGSVCYVATLNSSDTALPQAVLNATSPVTNNMRKQYIVIIVKTQTELLLLVCYYYKVSMPLNSLRRTFYSMSKILYYFRVIQCCVKYFLKVFQIQNAKYLRKCISNINTH